MWDAEDLEFSKRAIGRDWLESLPDELKERIESHHSEMFPKIENLPEWVNDNSEAQAIFNHLGNPDIEYLRDNSWYSLNIFEIDGEYWVAAQESDMDDALWDYLDGYDDNELLELWDAEDLEFSKRAIGRDWLESLPDELKERIESHHSEMFPKIENLPEWVNDNSEAQAIFNHLGNPDIEYLRDNSWYSLNIFEIDGEYWVAAQESDMDDALWDYLDGYDDNELLEYYDYDGDYLIMNDESYFVDTEVSEYLANLNEREIVENVGKDDELAELEDDLSEARSDLENAEEEENEEEIEELEAKIEELEDDIEVLHERAKDALEDSLRDDWFDCLSQGPVECLVNDKGWFRNARELLGSGLVWFDRDDLIDNITNYDNYELVTPYGYDEDQDDDGDWYYVFQVDI